MTTTRIQQHFEAGHTRTGRARLDSGLTSGVTLHRLSTDDSRHKRLSWCGQPLMDVGGYTLAALADNQLCKSCFPERVRVAAAMALAAGAATATLGLPHYHGYGMPPLVLAYRYWNAGAVSVVVVAKEGAAADWAAYIGGMANRGNGPAEEQVVAHVIGEGVKLSPDEAAGFFGPGGIGLRGGQAALPMEAYRP